MDKRLITIIDDDDGKIAWLLHLNLFFAVKKEVGARREGIVTASYVWWRGALLDFYRCFSSPSMMIPGMHAL
jgi:hypothetical protein